MSKTIRIILSILLLVSLTGCSKSEGKEPETQDPAPAVEPQKPQNDPDPVTDPQPGKSDSKTIRKEVREAIDAYEKFIDEYIAFMKKYEKSDNTLSMMKDYLSYVKKLSEYEEKMSGLQEDLNDAETKYFIEVMNRCNLKMLESLE
ncbi:MAG: hypothetical protein II126_03080 [Erysipelotrichaceae bacterium]|nr:hypothetical protein [Erysipelotrichaceae bacterium]